MAEAWYVFCPADGVVARYDNKEAAREHWLLMDDRVCQGEHSVEFRKDSHGFPIYSTTVEWAKAQDEKNYRLFL